MNGMFTTSLELFHEQILGFSKVIPSQMYVDECWRMTKNDF